MTEVRDTSIKTYNEIIDEGLVGEMQEKVLKCFRMLPKSTDREISEAHAIKINCVTGRRNELVNMGCLCEGEKRECRISGRKAYTWYVPDKMTFSQPKSKIKCLCCEGKGYVYAKIGAI